MYIQSGFQGVWTLKSMDIQLDWNAAKIPDRNKNEFKHWPIQLFFFFFQIESLGYSDIRPTRFHAPISFSTKLLLCWSHSHQHIMDKPFLLLLSLKIEKWSVGMNFEGRATSEVFGTDQSQVE